MQRHFENFEFEGLGQLEEIIATMPEAESRPIHVKGTGEINPFAEYHELMDKEEFWQTKNVAIVNTRTQNVAQIASSNYRILQHQPFFNMAVEMLRSAQVTDVRGTVTELYGGDAYIVKIICDSLEIEEPGKGRNIKIGVELRNSHNSDFAATGKAFFLRISCTNQMVAGKVIPECVFAKAHLAVDEAALLDQVTDRCGAFINKMEESGAKFQKTMIESMGDLVIYEDPSQLQEALTQIFKRKKYVDPIFDMAHAEAVRTRGMYNLQRWNLYGAATDYISHNDLSPYVYDTLMYQAETKLLMKPVIVPE